MSPLTPKQKEILDFIVQYSDQQGYAPSQKEIARHFGFSSLGTVQNYLTRLEREGLLEKPWNARRGLRVAEGSKQDYKRAVCLPLAGRVAAGRPIEAIESRESIEIPLSMLASGTRREDYFALRVQGDSMVEDGILNGDIAVIRKQVDATNGQTVVALIENEATIKKFFRRKGRIELHPANPAYSPLIVENNESFKIEGILAGIIRVL